LAGGSEEVADFFRYQWISEVITATATIPVFAKRRG